MIYLEKREQNFFLHWNSRNHKYVHIQMKHELRLKLKLQIFK